MRTVVRAATLLLWSLAIANPAIAQTSARPDAVSARAGTAPPRVSRIVVDAPDIDFEVGVPIRIGQRLLSVAPRTGHLVLRDLRSGERTVVPMGGSVVELGPASPDQRAVAYTGCAGKGCNDYELRTINLDGTKSRTVIAFGGKIDWITPYSWSPDGRQLLGVVNWSGGRRQIVFVSVADGEMRVAKDLDWRQPSAVALSPSGRYIVYDAQPEREKGARDLVVLDVKTHAETRVTTDGVPKAVVGWSAGGSGVFYTTVDADSATLWFVPVRNGRQSGSSRVIHRDLAAATDFRVVGSSVVFLRGDTRTTIYELPVDLETGQAGTPRPIISSSQISERAILSPAGNRIAFARSLTSSGDRVAVSLIDLNTAAAETFPFAFESLRLERWFADGRGLSAAASRGGRPANYRISVTMADGRMTASAGFIDSLPPSAPVRSLDGSTEYVVVRDETSDSNRIVARDIASGRERTLSVRYGANGLLRLSPDGGNLAVTVGGARSRARSTTGFVVITTGSDSREVLASDPSLSVGPNSLVWSPDGRHLLFRGFIGTDDNDGSQLWSAALGSGRTRRLYVESRDAFRQGSIQVAPDGRRVIYTVRPDRRLSEVWSIENVP